MTKLVQLRLILCILLCSAGIFVSGQSLLIDKVIAKVGGEYVLLSELEEQYQFASERQGVLEPNAKCGIFETIIIQKLLIDQAKLDSIELTEEEVNAQLDFRIDNIMRMMNGDEDRFREYYGRSVLEVRDLMRDDLRQQLLAERIQQNLINEVTITPQEVIAFYENIPSDSLPYLDSEVELSEIVIKPEVNDEQKRIAIDRLMSIRKQIVEEGADFAQLANRYSDDPGSSRSGGDLGTQKRGTFVPEFEAAAYNLEEGEISDIVESEFGFHIIQLLERRGNSIHSRHILIRPEITEEDLAKARSKTDSIRNLIFVDSLEFLNAVKRFTDKDAQSYTNSGRLLNPSSGNTFFEIDELPPEIYFAIENLGVGELSDVIEFQSPANETYFRFVKLESKTRPHKANLDQDYARIAQFAKESKKNEYFFNWIQDKIERTYIQIEDSDGFCENLNKWDKSN